MFDSLQDAFRQSLDNFRNELNRDRVPEAADRLLRAMRDELVEVRLQIDGLEADLDRVRAEAGSEEQAARTCLRREEMARRIGDEETASVAHDYARRHLQRHDILTEKAEVLAREVESRRAEYTQMTDQFREAKTTRESLAAASGRSEARDRMRDSEALFEEMDRMAERIDDFDHAAGAGAHIDDVLNADPPSPSGMRPDPEDVERELTEVELDVRLNELKRRMRDTPSG